MVSLTCLIVRLMDTSVKTCLAVASSSPLPLRQKSESIISDRLVNDRRLGVHYK